MNKYDLVRKIEDFAPLSAQEKWDCSGWVIDNSCSEVKRVMFALTVGDKVVSQAIEKNCDMIISHHPLFCVPIKWKCINIYCAHTNLDKASGGTTDRLIKELGFKISEAKEFTRIVYLKEPMSVENLKQRLLKISPNLRYINNKNTEIISSIGFCAGSGSEFINEAGTDAFVTGDLKFHTAFETNSVVFDIGHFESEIFAPIILKEITQIGENGVIADEKSPFIH